MSEQGKSDWRETATVFLMIGLVALFLSGPAVWTYQTYSWLKHGEWPIFTLWDGLYYLGVTPYPQVEWQGVQKIIDWIMMCPLGLSLFVIGGLSLWAITAIAKHYYEQKRLRESN